MSTRTTPAMPPQAESLLALFHHRWAVRVLVELREGRAGGRFAALRHRLDVGRATLRQTLEALIAGGLVRPNPGYGHPLRPEYLLTSRGEAIARWGARFLRSVRRAGLEDVAVRKWSMAVLLAIGDGHGRFSELEGALPGVTARALALALRELDGAGLVERQLVDGRPPHTRYRVAPPSRRLVKLLRDLPE